MVSEESKPEIYDLRHLLGLFIDDEVSEYYITRSKDVSVTDNKLTVDVGIWGEYTMLDYLHIEAVTVTSDLRPVLAPINLLLPEYEKVFLPRVMIG